MFFQAKIVLLTHPVGSHWGMMIRRVWHTESQVCNSNICSWEDIYYYCQQLRGQFTSLLTFVLRYSAWKPTIYPYFEGNQRMRVRPRKKETSILPPKWYSRRMMRKQHIFGNLFKTTTNFWSKTISHENEKKKVVSFFKDT